MSIIAISIRLLKSRYQDWWRKTPEIIDQVIKQQKLKLENEYDKDKLYYNQG